MRQKKLIQFPHLNDKGGDLSKDWYVEYAFRVPGSDKLHKYRTFGGMCRNVNSADERRKAANALITHITAWLKSGDYLNHDLNTQPVFITEAHRPETQNYKAMMETMRVRWNCKEWLETNKYSFRPATYDKYKGEFNIFCDWVETTLGDTAVEHITHDDLQRFLNYLAAPKEEGGRGLCHESIDQYRMRIAGVWQWMAKRGRVEKGVTDDLKAGGIYVDLSPIPFNMDERQRLKEAILPKQPYLWLACELMYYSAIRPGEIRLLKVGDVNPEKREITIRNSIAKNKRSQTVGITQETLDLMQRLGVFQYDKELYLFAHGWVPGDKPLGKSTLRERFAVYRKQLGIDGMHHFYSWKHSGLTDMLENGASIMTVKDHARHSNIDTTMRYAKKHAPNTHAFEEFVKRI